MPGNETIHFSFQMCSCTLSPKTAPCSLTAPHAHTSCFPSRTRQWHLRAWKGSFVCRNLTIFLDSSGPFQERLWVRHFITCPAERHRTFPPQLISLYLHYRTNLREGFCPRLANKDISPVPLSMVTQISFVLMNSLKQSSLGITSWNF